MKRQRYRPQAKGYSEAGASRTRRALRAFLPRSGAPSEDIDAHNYTLRQRARMLYMGSPLATSAINTARTKVVGTGLALRVQPNSDVLGLSPEAARDWARKTQAEWEIWAGKKRHCDALGMNNFFGLQQLALKSWLLSGDVFPLIKRYAPTQQNPYSLRIHLVEADRISTPAEYGGGLGALTEGIVPKGKPGEGHRIYDGIEVNDSGEAVAYYVCDSYPNQIGRLAKSPEWERIQAYGARTGLPNILHVMDCERPDQYRGVPYLAHVIEPLLQLRRYTESELVAALIQSFFTAWIKTETDPNELPFNSVGGMGGESDISGESRGGINDYEMAPGTVLHLAPGESVEFGHPNIPAAGFDAFTSAIGRSIGAALEIPYEVLMKYFNKSYSASRAALLEAWSAFKMRRAWFVDDFCQPIYEIWLHEAVARGRVQAPGFFDDPLIRAAWCGARWIGPTQGQIDPYKEVCAAKMQIDLGIKTHEQITIEQGGGDWEDNVRTLARENAALVAAGGGTDKILESLVVSADKEEE